jgi:protein-disulfide isomerase
VTAAPTGSTETSPPEVPDQDDRRPSGGISPLATAAIALIAGLVGLTIGATIGDDSQPPAAAPGAVEAAAEGASPITGTDARPVLGDEDAAVTIDLYSDFGCPFCGRHDRDTEPELIARYVETGQAKIVWHDVPFQGPTSVQLHVAARAAERQDRFWEFKEATFRTDGRDASSAMLQALATEAGLDLERFEADLADPALEQLVMSDLQSAQAAGVSGTPAFLVNGRPLMGAQPLPAFVELIEEALTDADVASS